MQHVHVQAVCVSRRACKLCSGPSGTQSSLKPCRQLASCSQLSQLLQNENFTCEKQLQASSLHSPSYKQPPRTPCKCCQLVGYECSISLNKSCLRKSAGTHAVSGPNLLSVQPHNHPKALYVALHVKVLEKGLYRTVAQFAPTVKGGGPQMHPPFPSGQPVPDDFTYCSSKGFQREELCT